MVTLVDFVVEFVLSAIRLIVIFLTDVAIQDPLAFISFVTGALLTTATLLFGGYLAVGAVLEMFGITFPSPGRTQPQRD